MLNQTKFMLLQEINIGMELVTSVQSLDDESLR